MNEFENSYKAKYDGQSPRQPIQLKSEIARTLTAAVCAKAFHKLIDHPEFSVIVKSAICPSCGAPVVFQSMASVFAVCAYCQSTLVREADELKNLGRMADLLEDNSPLQLSAEGRYRGVHFALIGRIQLQYEAGMWNEWHILFDDGVSGWLSDASGEMTVTFKVDPEQARVTETFDQLQPGQSVALGKQEFVVTNLEKARVIAAAGELPHGVQPGYDAPVVDLRMQDSAEVKVEKSSTSTPFASIDYSDDPPSVFIGESLPFAELKLTGLKEGMPIPGIAPGKMLQVRAFTCPSCGAPLSAHAQEIVTVACAGCGTVLDLNNDILKVIARGKAAQTFKPAIPLGSKGLFYGVEYELIGLIVQKTRADGIDYFWREYLLHAPQSGFRWLTEYNGHWNFVMPIAKLPTDAQVGGRPGVKLDGVAYNRFQTSKAVIEQVVGEFYWRVRKGDTVQVIDYIAPPYVLSCEKTAKEKNWSRGEYIESSDVRKAFTLKGSLLGKTGVGANQPSPYEKSRVGTICLSLAVLGILVQVLLILLNSGGKVVLDHKMKFTPHGKDEMALIQNPAITPTISPDDLSAPNTEARAVSTTPSGGTAFSTLRTPVFHFDGGHLLVSDMVTIDDNRWFGVDLTLVNQKTGREIPAYRELYRASGRDSDGAWNENKTEDNILFRNVEAGDYYFLVDTINDVTSTAHGVLNIQAAQSSLRVQARRADVGWGNWWLLNGYLLLLGLIAVWRKESFEVKRWSESDYPRASWATGLKSSDSDD